MRVNIVGVPNSAGAYCVGVEDAPAALRRAGLVEALVGGGADVLDAGDLTARRWVPDRQNPLLQNLDEEVAALRELADAAAPLLRKGSRLLVLGGSCTVALGVCAAIRRVGVRPRLVYVDRHLDLNTASTTAEGSLSWMGMAHALGVDGAAPELVHATGDGPILQPSDLVYLGVDLEQTTDGEREHLRALGVTVVPQVDLTERPQAAASTALVAISGGPYFVHLDVDVLDFVDMPIAENVNGRNSGPSLAQVEQALVQLCAHADCLGLSIGQLDPGHASADPTALNRLVTTLAAAVAGAPTPNA